MRETRIGELQKLWRIDFTDKQQYKIEQRHRYNWRNSHVRNLAEAASGVVLPTGVRVRHDFQKEE